MSSNEGATWAYNNFSGYNLRDVIVNSSDEVFVAAGNQVFRSNDHGNTWTNVSAGLAGADVYSLGVDADGRLFAGLYGAMIYRSVDNGNTWQALTIGLSNQTVYTSMAVNSDGDIFAGTNGAHIYRSTNHGDSWTRLISGLSSPEVWALEIDSDDRIFAGTGNGVCTSINNGTTWTLAPQTEGDFDVNDMTINSEDHIFVTNYYGGVWRTTDHGNTWEDIGDPTDSEVSWGLAMDTQDYFYCGAANGQVYRSAQPTVSNPSTFVPINAGLQAVYRSSAEWGDFDSDGDLDLLMVGTDDAENYAKIYRNDGSHTFVEVTTAGLQAVINGPVTWGDYDNDGDLDVLLTGYDGGSTNFSIVYQNEGGGTFTDLGLDLVPMGSGSVDWGDYDNDGDLDIFMTGWNGTTSYALIYRNDVGSFVDIDAGLPGVRTGSCLWGDYDNDGDLDILLTGWNGTVAFTQIFNNDDGIFVDINAGLAVVNGSAAWGDYDGDGDLDLLLTGYQSGAPNSTYLYRNDNSTFVEVSSGLPGVNQSSVAWGDYDNDGDLDILLSGWDGTNRHTDIFQNDAGTFTVVNAGLPAVRAGALAWGDYDNDGDLDLLLAGQNSDEYPHSEIYRNDSETTNTRPQPPQNLSSSISDDDVILSWSAASDSETPTSGLTYNIRIGTTPNGEEVKGSHSDPATGFRELVLPGNVQNVMSWTIHDLADGEYYWSVQSIDNAFAGSPFASEQFFTTVALEESAPTVTTNSAIEITTSSATLNGVVNPGNLSTSLEFEYGPTTSYGTTLTLLNPINGAADVPVDAELSGLTAGSTYHYRLVATNALGSTNGEDQVFTTLYVESAPTVITNSATEMTPSNAILHGIVNPGNLSTSLEFEYGPTVSYGTTLTLLNPIDGTEDVPVSAELSGLTAGSTYHYRLVATNALGSTNGEDQEFTTVTIYPETFTLETFTDFPFHENADEYTVADYRIFGLPGSSSLLVSDFLSGNQNEDWQVFWDNGNTSDYLVEFNGSSDFEFSVGRAFWVINAGRMEISGSSPSAPLNSDNQVELPLHSGWNLITNPVMSSIPWLTIQDVNDIADPIWAFDGSFVQANSFNYYEGYYYFNTDDLSHLNIPFQSPTLTKTVKVTEDSEQWDASIILTTGNQQDRSARFGVRADASESLDRHDFHKPHAVGGQPGVSFNRPNWDADHPVFASDIRPVDDDYLTWDFELENIGDETSQLSFEGLDQIPPEYDVYLINLQDGQAIDLRTNPVNQFQPNSSGMAFKLAVGSPEQVQKDMDSFKPTTPFIGQNYPNPFNPSTTLSYRLPVASNVSLIIYDVQGNVVRVLDSGAQSAGWYNVVWNGTTSDGSPISTGIYFARFVAGDFSQVVKMLYLK